MKKIMSLSLEQLRDIVEQKFRTIINVYGYLHGKCYDAEITSIIDNGDLKIFGVGNADIEKIIKESPLYSHKLEFEDFIVMCNENLYLSRALGDLRDAVRSSSLDTGFYCYRAIEDIKNHFGEEIFLDNYDGKNSDHLTEAWELFRNNLCIMTKDELDKLNKGLDELGRKLGLTLSFDNENKK